MPMVVCVLVAVLANFALAPRLGIFGVGLSMTIAYSVMCAVLAVRLHIWPMLAGRLPGWITAAAMVLVVVRVVGLAHLSLVVRLVTLCAMSSLVWVAGIALFPSGRTDLAVLRDQLRRVAIRRGVARGRAFDAYGG